MTWRIAIPSYKRPTQLRDATLALLRKHHIPAERIDVFVADAAEEAVYTATLDPATYSSLIVAVPGMGAVRNFMTDYYSEGQHILFIDDDITDFLTLTDAPFTLSALIDHGFAECVERGLRLWGIYPVANRYFMSGGMTDGLTYIVGCFYGCINNRSIHVTLDDKEDYERTLLYYLADGGVLRYRWVAPLTRYYKNPGGMATTRTMERILESAQILATRYPGLCRLNLTKKSGLPEVRLLRLKRRVL
jgi:hypothetical protein